MKIIFIITLTLSIAGGLFANGAADNRTMNGLIEHFSRYHTITEKEQITTVSYNMRLDGLHVMIQQHAFINMWYDTYNNPVELLGIGYIYSNGLFSMQVSRLDALLSIIEYINPLLNVIEGYTDEEMDYAMVLFHSEKRRIAETLMRF